MDKKINVISDIEHELEVNLTYDEIKTDLAKHYKEETKNLQVDGFRKGKVPTNVIKRIYGDAIEYKASEKIANKFFWDTVDADGLKPISTPALSDLDYKEKEGLTFKVRYEIKPKLALKDYKSIEIEKIVDVVKDTEVDNEINYILKQHSTFVEADLIDSSNYRITADLQRYDEANQPMEGHSSKNMVIDLSDEKVNPQIAENCLNKKVGEVFNFEFVDDRAVVNENSPAEKYLYQGTITKIEKVVLPETTDEFVKSISQNKATSFEEYRTYLKKQMIEYYETQADNIYTNSLINKVVENNDFEAPKGYVEFLLNRFVEEEVEKAKKQANKNVDEKQLRTTLQPKAVWNAKWQIILENLVEAEGITVEDRDLEILAKDEAEKYNLPVEKLMEYYKKTNRSEMLLEEKVIKFLKENSTPKEITAEEKFAQQQAEKINEAPKEEKPKKTRTKKTEE